MKLVIVESPTKAQTIGAFLGDEYRVESSYGHIRDLPKSKIGVDVEHNFEPQYVIPTKVRKRVNQLKKDAQKVDEVILATDEDREGEAIAWHLQQALELNDYERIVFHEITESAITDALAHPRKISEDLVNAQQARRVLDRLVGYKLSPFLWKKVANGLSAGRVQSVALRFVVDREKEIRAFVPDTYWSIDVAYPGCVASLARIDDKALPKPGLMDNTKVQKIVTDLKSHEHTVSLVSTKEVQKHPLPPFTTSTLQQEASKRLRFSAKQTMRVAQNLYERGLITYMRTDSVQLSQESLKQAQSWITKELGKEYQLPSPRTFKQKSRLAQEAHEAIRPTNLLATPTLEAREEKLYDLIKRRFVASQLPPARFSRTTLELTVTTDAHSYLVRANGNVLVFDGYLRVWPQTFETKEVPTLKEGSSLSPEKVEAIEHQTEAPPRFNEASLIKALEEHGIGRPSTYAPTVSLIQDRNYVEKDEQRRFLPTEIGELVSTMLTEHFPRIVDVDFTAQLEEELDDVATGSKNWRTVVRAFYEPFEENLTRKYEEISKEDVVGKDQETDEVCDKCGKPMVIKRGRFGKFLACSGFPECKNTKSLIDESNDFGSCPTCEEGTVIRRKTKRGRWFYGCSRYPDCDFASWKKPGQDASE